MKTAQEWFSEEGICRKGVKWLGEGTIKEAWDRSESAEMMFCLCDFAGVKDKRVSVAALDISETVLKYIRDAECLKVCKAAIEAGRDYLAGTIDLTEIQAAGAFWSAWSAAWSADGSADGSAGTASLWAAYSAYSACSAYSAYSAATAATWAARSAADATRASKKHASIVRNVVPYSLVAERLAAIGVEAG